MMCPQLFINYKLKSVAHLPWRQMTYKFLNTIIDDLFAFVIKMPILHRLSVFRDGEFNRARYSLYFGFRYSKILTLMNLCVCFRCDILDLLIPKVGLPCGQNTC